MAVQVGLTGDRYTFCIVLTAEIVGEGELSLPLSYTARREGGRRVWRYNHMHS
jgi:hypothetical protein